MKSNDIKEVTLEELTKILGYNPRLEIKEAFVTMEPVVCGKQSYCLLGNTSEDGNAEIFNGSVYCYDHKGANKATIRYNIKDFGYASVKGYDYKYSHIIGDKEKLKVDSEELNILADKLRKNRTVVTHIIDDLDNKSSIYALEKWARENNIIGKNESINVERVPSGEVKEGMINLDIGRYKGTQIDTETIVIDGDAFSKKDKTVAKTTCDALYKLGIYVPKQIRDYADKLPKNIASLGLNSGLVLSRYIKGSQIFKLANAGLLDKELTDKQLEKYGVRDSYKIQKAKMEDALEELNA